MIILGLHFGHDGAVAVIKDGEIKSCLVRERHVRSKHACFVTADLVSKCLSQAGVTATDVDLCAICSTQNMDIVTDDASRLDVQLTTKNSTGIPSSFSELLSATAAANPTTPLLKASFASYPTYVGGCEGLPVEEVMVPYSEEALQGLTRRVSDPRINERVQLEAFQYAQPNPSHVVSYTGWIDDYIFINGRWDRGFSLAELANQDFTDIVNSPNVRFGFHHPATLTLDGRQIPAFFIHHHAAHAACGFYLSNFHEAAIFTNDGGNGYSYHGGMFYYGEGEKIYPITPHFMAPGDLYRRMSIEVIGWRGEGKFMGLSSYGKPAFFKREFVGNWNELCRGFGEEPANPWLQHCKSAGQKMGYDLSDFANKEKLTTPFNADFAASTQLLFEETMLAGINAEARLMRNMKLHTKNLCVAGGVVLNCPTNSRIALETHYSNVFAEPCCDDSGLAIGAGLFLYHNLLGSPRVVKTSSMSPYVGATYRIDDIQLALEERADRLVWERPVNLAKTAAKLLAENKVLGWFEGRSEIGPRALGHRSIIADPRHGSNWQRVNTIKGREQWRPFAPAVLESECMNWFEGAPSHSPYMLFTAKSRSSLIPAVTHVDGTARIQTVGPENGAYFDLISEFFRITSVPVVLNTSFNGPTEPIVEAPRDAVQFFLHSELDVLCIDGFLVYRKTKS